MQNNKSENKLDALLKTAGEKLGISPEALRAALNDPQKAEQIISGINKKAGDGINSESTRSLENMINKNPKARKLYDDIMRGGKNG